MAKDNSKNGNRYSDEDIERIFNIICDKIELGYPWTRAIKLNPDDLDSKEQHVCNGTFYTWLADSSKPHLSERYRRAMTICHDILADDVLKEGVNERISTVTKVTPDGLTVITQDNVARSAEANRARQWYLKKLAPAKYGDNAEQQETHVEQPMFNDID